MRDESIETIDSTNNADFEKFRRNQMSSTTAINIISSTTSLSQNTTRFNQSEIKFSSKSSHVSTYPFLLLAMNFVLVFA